MAVDSKVKLLSSNLKISQHLPGIAMNYLWVFLFLFLKVSRSKIKQSLGGYILLIIKVNKSRVKHMQLINKYQNIMNNAGSDQYPILNPPMIY